MAEKLHIAAIKSGIVVKAAVFIDLRRLSAHQDEVLRIKQSFICDIFFGTVFQFTFKQTKNITFRDEKSVGDLSYAFDSKQIGIDVFQYI